MAKPSKIAEIAEALLSYLEVKDDEWQAQPAKSRRPTLPFTNDGKVNVLGLVRAIGLKDSAANNYMHNPRFRRELADPVNVIARVQGLKPIGSRAIDDAADDAALTTIGRLSQEVTAQTDRHAQAKILVAQLERANADLRQENLALKRRLEFVQLTGCVLRINNIEG